eukprot:COSAG02_NODE_46078_length_352_cov_0.521739_1_plen_66_part_10
MAILGVCAIMACHARRGVTMHSARAQTYAARAVELIDTFVLYPRTKMNPNVRFGQSLGMPCEPPSC